MDANDIQAVVMLQNAWIRTGSTKAIRLVLHAMRYLRNREKYQAEKERMHDLASIRARKSRLAIEQAEIVDL